MPFIYLYRSRRRQGAYGIARDFDEKLRLREMVQRWSDWCSNSPHSVCGDVRQVSRVEGSGFWYIGGSDQGASFNCGRWV